MKSITIGMDLGDKNHVVCVLDSTGKAINSCSIKNTQESLNKVKTAGEVATREDTEKQMKNASAVDDMYVIEQIRRDELAKKANASQQATTEAIKDAGTTEVVEKVKNSIGMEFPEGVTEEQFSQSGSDGTIHTIITRRIVVIDGHGDVYIRTQRDGMETFKKNEQSITKYTWQKETQSSKLVRH